MNTLENPAAQAALSVVRSVLNSAGTILVFNGLIKQEVFDQLLGAAIVITPVLWGMWQKYQAERAAKHRETVAVAVGMVIADATIGATPLIPPIKVPEVLAAIAPRIIVPIDKAAPPLVLPVRTL
jgi:hypothetical protein